MVVVVNVAVSTLPRRNRVHAGKRKPGTVMVERCIQPGGRAVTLVAGLREIRGHVIRIGRALKIPQVAADTGGRGQVVIVVHVAIGTLPRGNSVHAGKRESHRVVIK